MDARGGKKISHRSPLVGYYGSKSNSESQLDEFVVYEIWSRLPVKSLIRFKCVCKKWLVDIAEKDRYFVELHFNRSISRHSSFLLPSGYVSSLGAVCLWSAPFNEEGDVGNTQTLMPFTGESYLMLNIVNGLICFIDYQRCSVCVYNPSTRELTPWFKSIIKQQEEVEFISQKQNKYGTVTNKNGQYESAFGYDCVSGEYKVVSLWTERRCHDEELSNMCEVLTICGNEREQNTRQWRRIDAVPPHEHLGKAVYANGSIYWLLLCPIWAKDGNEQPKLVKFNVGKETFEVIHLPDFIIDDINDEYCVGAIEVDGHFSLLVKKIKDEFAKSRKWSKNNSTEVNLYILYDDADCNGNYYWKVEMFSLPPFDNWIPIRKDSILPIAGTDLFIIRCFASWSFYIFNWKKKTLSNRKFEVPHSSDLFAEMDPDYLIFCTYVESILPVN